MPVSMSGTGGMNMLHGIQLHLDASGVVKGTTIANYQLDKIATTAKRTARQVQGVSNAAKDFQHIALQASAALGAYGFAIHQFGTKITENFTKPIIEGAGKYEVAMSRMQFATNATAKEMQDLDKVMIRTGLETIETPVSAANAFTSLRTAGLKTKEALDLLPKTIQMVTGSAGMLGMDEAIRASVAAVKKFQHQGVPFAKTLDDIAQATRETALKWENMPAFINSLQDAPMKLRATSAEILTLGGIMKAGGMQAAQAGQSIQIFANKMITNDRKIQAVMMKKGLTKEQFLGIADSELRQRMIMLRKFGISMFDAADKMKPFQQILREVIIRMEELMAKSDQEGLLTLSGTFAQQAGSMVSMLTMLKEKGISAADMFSKLVTNVDNSAGALKRAEEAALRTAWGINKLKEGTEETIQIILGNTILPVYVKFLKMTKGILDNFLQFLSTHKIFARALTVTTVLVGFLATAIGLLAIAMAGAVFYTVVLKAALMSVNGMAGAAALGIGALKASLMFLLPVVGGVALAFGVLYGAFKLFEHISKATSGVPLAIKQFFQDIQLVIQGFMEWWDGEGPTSLFRKLEARGLDDFVGALLQGALRIRYIFRGIGQVFEVVGIGLRYFGKTLMVLFGFVLDRIMALFKLFGMYDMRKELVVWEKLGIAIGTFLVPALTVAAAYLVVVIVRQVALAAATALAAAKFILLVAAIAVYLGALKSAWDFGEKLGPAMGEWVDKLRIKMFKDMAFFRDLGKQVVWWFQEGMTSSWDDLAAWYTDAINALWTRFKNMFGAASDADVEAAMNKVYGHTAVARTSTDKAAELAYEVSRGTAGAQDSYNRVIQRESAYAQARYAGIPLEAPRRGTSDPDVTGKLSRGRDVAGAQIGSITVNITGDPESALRKDAKKFAQRVAESVKQRVDNDWEIEHR